MNNKIEILKELLSKEDLQVLAEARGVDVDSFEMLLTLTKGENKKILKARAKRESARGALTKEEIRYIKRLCNNYRITEREKLNDLLAHFDVSEEKIRRWIDELDLSISPSQYSMAAFHDLKESRRYIISSAQNASPVNSNFLANMEAYAKYIGAEIGIIATRYKNPTSTFVKEGDVWDNKVHKYLTAKRQELHPNLILLADLKIQATAPNPTNGIELFGGDKSAICGAPRVEMRSLPVLEDHLQKFLYSTGTVTVPNFTDSVAGGKAAEHHTYGFIVVEIESDKVVHVRNVSAHEDGSFNDLAFRVEDEEVSLELVDTFVWGDSHFAQKDDKVTNAFRKLCEDLGISRSVLHDVWDSQSVNVHNLNNPVEQLRLHKTGKNNLKKELKQMAKELQWFEDNMEETLVVASNHDDMIDRAIVTTHWKDHIHNAETFVKLTKLVTDGKADNGVIPYCINKKFNKIKALGVDDSYILHGVELALHGHKGPNGSRGSITSFAKLSNKTIIGHSHSPGIKWGCYQVGVSCALKHGYNKGLSSWAYSGVLLNNRGKRQSIVFNKDTLTYTTLY